MSTIAVLCKWCADPADLVVRSDGTISSERAHWAVSEYDRVALEVGLTVAGPADSVVAVVAGPPGIDTPLTRKAILSRGAHSLTFVVDDSLQDADARQTARAIVAAVKRLPDVRLVLCGAGSADVYSQQVGVQVAALLGWVALDGVSRVELDTDTCRVDRRLAGSVDTLEGALPAVLAVTSDAAVPRVPGMRDILEAAKKPVTRWDAADLGPSAFVSRPSRVRSTVARRPPQRRQVRLDGPVADVANQLVDVLQKEGAL